MISALCTASCYGEWCMQTTEMDIEDQSERIIMNGLLNTELTSHSVYLYWSGVSDTRPMNGATLTATVNGTVYVATPSDDPESGLYTLNCALNPGDRVSFEARPSGGGASATAQTVVPSRVEPIKVDTARVSIDYGYEKLTALQFRVTIADDPSVKNYYRIRGRRISTVDNGGGSTTEVVTQLHFDGSSDPIISEGNSMDDELGLASLFAVQNTSCVFSDDLFPGETRRIRLNLTYLDFFATEDSSGGSTVTGSRIEIWLEHINFDHYLYLRAINNLESLGYDANFIFEPTTIPSNVEGGIGLIDIAASSQIFSFTEPDE